MLNRYQRPEQYLRFVQSEMTDQALERFYASPLRPGVVLGRQEFVDRINEANSGTVEVEPGISAITIEDIDSFVAQAANCSPTELRGSNNALTATARRVAADLSHLVTDASRSELAERYGYPSPAAAGQAIAKTRRSPKENVQILRQSTLSALGLDDQGHPVAGEAAKTDRNRV